MKRVFLFLTIFMMVFCAHAQYGQTQTQYFDSVFINIAVPAGIYLLKAELEDGSIEVLKVVKK